MFNQTYVNEQYLKQLQAQVHQNVQNAEIYKAARAIRDYCEAVKKITPDYQKACFVACATVILEEFGDKTQYI